MGGDRAVDPGDQCHSHGAYPGGGGPFCVEALAMTLDDVEVWIITPLMVLAVLYVASQLVAETWRKGRP